MRIPDVRESEDGFTMIELLIVVLVLGILAGLALTNFLQQQKKGHDVAAKSYARELTSHVEACFVESSDYTECDSPGELRTVLNLAYGNQAGEVEVVGAGEQSFTIIAHSRSGADFRIVKTDGARPERTCSPRDGGCRDNGTW